GPVKTVWRPRRCTPGGHPPGARPRGSPRLREGPSEEGAEPADKPGSVVDSHSSRRIVTDTLKQPTRRHRGPRHCLPIWSCSRWGLPCRPVARLAVRSYRTVSPLPDPATLAGAGPSAVCSLLHFPSARAAQALPGTVPCGARTFLGMLAHDATAWPTPRGHSTGFAATAKLFRWPAAGRCGIAVLRGGRLSGAQAGPAGLTARRCPRTGSRRCDRPGHRAVDW